MFGFLNVYKPSGMTSHDVVARLRRVVKIKQIGHTGTLDPFAQGVLPVAIGKATRLIEFLKDDKEYLAEISFGKSTDTYDLDGDTVYEAPEGWSVSKEDILENLQFFRGEILQTPPIYSAIKVGGKKLYEYARKGESVEIEARKVFIEKIELVNYDESSHIAQVLIKCSKGTYIRSIAHDLGQKLGVGAYLSKLIRTQAGDFFVDSALKLEDFVEFKGVQDNLINPVDMVNLPKLVIDDTEQKKVLAGQFFQNLNDKFNELDFIILIYNDNVSAVAQVENSLIKVKKVFV